MASSSSPQPYMYPRGTLKTPEDLQRAPREYLQCATIGDPKGSVRLILWLVLWLILWLVLWIGLEGFFGIS